VGRPKKKRPDWDSKLWTSGLERHLPVNQLTKKKNQKFWSPQIYLATHSRKPFGDIWYGLREKWLSRVGGVKENYLRKLFQLDFFSCLKFLKPHGSINFYGFYARVKCLESGTYDLFEIFRHTITFQTTWHCRTGFFDFRFLTKIESIRQFLDLNFFLNGNFKKLTKIWNSTK
jgi:hypothetical protein